MTLVVACCFKCGAQPLHIPTSATFPRDQIEGLISAAGWLVVAGSKATAAVCPACTPKALDMIADKKNEPNGARWYAPGDGIELARREFDRMRHVAGLGITVVVGMMEAHEPGELMLRVPAGRVEIERRATREEYLLNVGAVGGVPDDRVARAPFYYAVKVLPNE